MKCVLILLVAIAATLTCSQAQTTSGPVLPQPVTACGKRALKCYRDVKPTMDTADAAFDYVKVCRQFKLYEDCFDTVLDDPHCTNETEVTGVNDVVLNDRDGICLTDGTVTVCGSTVQTCMGEAMAIVDAYQRKNVTAACTLNGKIETCQDQVDNLKDCAAKIKTAVDTVATGIVEDGYLVGCEGACGEKLGKCMNNVTNLLVSGDFLNIDWSGMCSDVYTALDCVRQISTDSDCVGNQQLASMLDAQNQVFGDYCAGRGQPSACIQQLQQCTSDWKAVGTNVPVQGRCQADATYLECSSKIPCAAELQGVLIKLRSQIDDAETNSQCPIIGSCADRLTTCNSLSADIITTSSPTSRCDTTKTALSCFDFVRSDANCVTENLAKTDFEAELPGSLDTVCPNPCADRLAYCSFWEAALKNVNKATQGDQYCRLATSGNACFNKVRTDTMCQDASLAKSAFETSLQSDLTSTCAAGNLVASAFLVCTVVMMRVLRYL